MMAPWNDVMDDQGVELADLVYKVDEVEVRRRERARVAGMLREQANEEGARARATKGIHHPVYDQAQRTAAAWRQAAIAVEGME